MTHKLDLEIKKYSILSPDLMILSMDIAQHSIIATGATFINKIMINNIRDFIRDRLEKKGSLGIYENPELINSNPFNMNKKSFDKFILWMNFVAEFKDYSKEISLSRWIYLFSNIWNPNLGYQLTHISETDLQHVRSLAKLIISEELEKSFQYYSINTRNLTFDDGKYLDPDLLSPWDKYVYEIMLEEGTGIDIAIDARIAYFGINFLHNKFAYFYSRYIPRSIRDNLVLELTAQNETMIEHRNMLPTLRLEDLIYTPEYLDEMKP